MIIFFCRDASWHVRTGWGFWMGVYDNWYFCRDDVYIVPISEWENIVIREWILLQWYLIMIF